MKISSFKKYIYYVIIISFTFLFTFFVTTIVLCIFDIGTNEANDTIDEINGHIYDIIIENRTPAEVFGNDSLPNCKSDKYNSKKYYHMIVYGVDDKKIASKFEDEFSEDVAIIRKDGNELNLHILTNELNRARKFLQEAI